MSQINLNLSQLANGGIQEKINSELEKVLDNIMDPNTSPKEKRKLVITLTFSPNEDRSLITTEANIKPSLAAQNNVSTMIMAEKDWKTGEIYANELQSGAKGQTFFDNNGYLRTDTGELIEDKAESSTIVDFNKKRASN